MAASKDMSLEQRVAAALADPELGSEPLVQLIAEVETASREADAVAAKARADALDPTVAVDVAQASAKVTAAELTRDRMNAALPKLQELLKDSRAQEALRVWRADFERVKAERDRMVAELRERYPMLVDELVGLMHRIAAVDKEVNRINGSGPSYLHTVEREARGQLFQPDIPLTGPNGLRLPVLYRNGGPIYAWPPPQPSLVEQMGGIPVPMGGVFGPDWHEKLGQRDAELRVQLNQAAEEAAARQREREKREKAELEALRESERQRVLAAMHPGAR
jgi:hypothetical protein